MTETALNERIAELQEIDDSAIAGYSMIDGRCIKPWNSNLTRPKMAAGIDCQPRK